MAIIDIKYSQDVVDNLHQSSLNTALIDGSIGSIVDSMLITAYILSNRYPKADSYTTEGASLRLGYTDGAFQTYSGLSNDVEAAPSGAVTAGSVAFYRSGLVSMYEAGKLRYDYSATNTAYEFDPSVAGSEVTTMRMMTLLPSDAPGYRTLTGNAYIQVDGAMVGAENHDLTGSISRIGIAAEKFVLSGLIEGDFQLSTNTLAAGQGQTKSAVSGTVSGFKEDYRDGSHAWFSELGLAIEPMQAVSVSMIGNASHFAGNDLISVDMPANLFQPFNVASGAGNDRISVAGGGGKLHVNAGSGNDVIGIASGAHLINGDAGLDQVQLLGKRASYTVKSDGKDFKLTDAAGAVSTLQGVERLAFVDAHVALDIDGVGGQAYRLYQAAFDRTPDLPGVGFHMWAMETVGWDLTRVAQGFIESPEFNATYGKLSNHDFVVQLYANVLHRAPDAAGLKFHVDLLDAGTVTRAQDLMGFSESPENKAALIGVIGNGFEFIPYV